MDEHMLLMIGRSTELLVADVAFIRLFALVDSLMSSQVGNL